MEGIEGGTEDGKGSWRKKKVVTIKEVRKEETERRKGETVQAGRRKRREQDEVGKEA